MTVRCTIRLAAGICGCTGVWKKIYALSTWRVCRQSGSQSYPPRLIVSSLPEYSTPENVDRAICVFLSDDVKSRLRENAVTHVDGRLKLLNFLEHPFREVKMVPTYRVHSLSDNLACVFIPMCLQASRIAQSKSDKPILQDCRRLT